MLNSILISFRSLPLWVQVWVLVLVCVNAACVLFLSTLTGQATAVAAIFVLLTNTPLLLYYRGMNRALSIPHLFAWIPLQVYLVQHLFLQKQVPLANGEMVYGLGILAINGISLGFDLLDSWRWLKGERETPGVPG